MASPLAPHRFGILMLAILLMILVRPWLDGLANVRLFTDLCFAAIFLSALLAIHGRGHQFALGLALAAAAFAARIVHRLTGIEAFDGLSSGLAGLFFLQAVFGIGAYIRAERIVTLEVIFAAICAYLLLGMIFAQADYLLENRVPGSFKASEPLAEDVWNFVYYSFVTLTTLGYGDIVAASKAARSLSLLEAIVGQLYLAVLIGWLVGAYSAEFRGRAK